jgi:site-specific DNA recombinase
MQAVGYTRVSTDEQARGYSLQTQFTAIQKYAAQRGYNLTAEFRDDYTGASMDRPALNRLREHIAHNRVDRVIVFDIDRLARKSVYQMLIEEELAKRGTLVEYVTGQYENTDEGRLQKQIRSTIAEYEKAKILERMKRGKRGKAQSGFTICAARPPYGYTIKSEPHKSWLEVDPAESDVVPLVFQWYLYPDGKVPPLSIRGIAAKLSALHIPTRGDGANSVAKKNGRGEWSGAMVRHILTNETYAGTWHYGKTRMMDESELSSLGDDKRLKTLRNSERKQRQQANSNGKASADKMQAPVPRDEWTAVTVPAIVDRRTFTAAAARLGLNKEQATRNARREYLLGRRLKCAKCGYSMVGRTRREKHQYYYCNGREKTPGAQCDVMPVRCDELDSAVWDWVKGTLQHPERLAVGLRGEKAEAQRANRAIQDRLELVVASLAENNQQLAKLLDVYLVGGFPPELLADRRAQLEKHAADLEHERQGLQAHMSEEVWTESKIQEVETAVREIAEGLDGATFEDKRRYFDLLDVRATFAVEDGAKVAYVKCRLGLRRLSVVPTSPLQSNHNGQAEAADYLLTARLVLAELQGGDLANALFAAAPAPRAVEVNHGH